MASSEKLIDPLVEQTLPPSKVYSHLTSEPLLTVEDVACYLQLMPATIRAMVRRGELPAIKVGRQWRFHRESIESWIQSRGE